MKKFFLILFCTIFFCGCTNQNAHKTILKFSAWGSQSEIAILTPLLKEFEEENPDLKIEFVHIPQNYFQKLHLLFASNLAPDVVFMNNFYSQKYIKAGLLEDLTPYFQKELNEKIFFEKAVKSSSHQERLYVLPRDISDVVVYYNKDIFERYKIPYPAPNWTKEDFLKTAQNLSKDDIWGVGFEKDPLFWLPFLYSDGAAILSDDGENFILNSPKGLHALQFYADLRNKYKAAPTDKDSASLTMAQLFIQGRLAMQISGRWLVPKYRSDVKFDWDIAPIPAGSNGSVTGIDTSGYSISSSSKHKEEAVKLIKFLSTKENSQKLAQSGLIVPARKDAAYSDAFLAPDKKPKHSLIFLEAVQKGKVTPVNEDYQRLTDRLNTRLEPLFAGQKTAQQVLKH